MSDLKPAGQTYIRYNGREQKVCGYKIEYTDSWKYAKRCRTELSICGLVEDVSCEYMFDMNYVMNQSEMYFINRFRSNDVLSFKYMKKVVPYFTMAFGRFFQRREGHHGILTYGCAGIPELKSHHVTPAVWVQCCSMFMKMSGFNEEKFLSMYNNYYSKGRFLKLNGRPLLLQN